MFLNSSIYDPYMGRFSRVLGARLLQRTTEMLTRILIPHPAGPATGLPLHTFNERCFLSVNLDVSCWPAAVWIVLWPVNSCCITPTVPCVLLFVLLCSCHLGFRV